MNYIARITGKLAELLPDCPPDLLRFYAVLVLVLGTGTGWDDVHDAWSAWRDITRPDHPSLIPYGLLSGEVKALDSPYAKAIHQAAIWWRDDKHDRTLHAQPATTGGQT